MGKKFHDGMILKTNFIEIIGRRVQECVFGFALVPDDLGQWSVNNFIGIKISQGFKIIAGPFPLGQGHFIMVADQLFGHGCRLIDDNDLFRTECVHIVLKNVNKVEIWLHNQLGGPLTPYKIIQPKQMKFIITHFFIQGIENRF